MLNLIQHPKKSNNCRTLKEVLGSRFTSMRALIILFFILFLFYPLYALDVPKLQGYVNDYANMISPSAETEINNELKAFEQTDSTQIVILTIPSLEGEVLEDFSIKVAEAWKIGQKVKDNGVIFLVAKKERKIRIEVGRGLEGRLTDLMAGRIIDLVIKPRFKREDFDGGFIAGVSSLIDATRGEFKADEHRKEPNHFVQIFSVLLFVAAIAIFYGSLSRLLGGILTAVGLPAFIHFLISPLGIISALAIGFLGLVVGLFLPKLLTILLSYSGGDWSGWGRGDSFGGYHDFSGGGGGSGGGSGFGGGGGSGFGGGGASGGW
jgi:uncharacterized protein